MRDGFDACHIGRVTFAKSAGLRTHESVAGPMAAGNEITRRDTASTFGRTALSEYSFHRQRVLDAPPKIFRNWLDQVDSYGY
jgi:hypothetical protein